MLESESKPKEGKEAKVSTDLRVNRHNQRSNSFKATRSPVLYYFNDTIKQYNVYSIRKKMNYLLKLNRLRTSATL